MEEQNTTPELENIPAVKPPFSKRLENFWYHYKIHTIAAIFIIVAVTICTLQFCSKPKFDAYVLYAGDERVSNVRMDGDLSEYEKFQNAMKRVTPDQNENGEVLVAIENLFVANEAELLLLEERGENVDNVASLISEDSESLYFYMLSGDYYLLFLSERLFLEYDGEYGGGVFVDLSVYGGENLRYVGDGTRGIYLDSFEKFSELDGIASLDPADTVVCLRKINALSSKANGKKNVKSFDTAEAILKKIIEYD